MEREQLQAEIDSLQWFHRIYLPFTYQGKTWGHLKTPGIVDHCTEELATERFGIPLVLADKLVLDVGAYDGYFSFLAERRGAEVIAIDSLQDCSNRRHTASGFQLAAKCLDFRGAFYPFSLQEFTQKWGAGLSQGNKNAIGFHVIFYFGVLYHVENPLKELQCLYELVRPGGYVLIETAMVPRKGFLRELVDRHMGWELIPGHNGDSTNYWYPSYYGLGRALRDVGFKSCELIHTTKDGARATFKASK